MTTNQTTPPPSPSYAYAIFISNSRSSRGGGGGGWNDFYTFAYTLEEAKQYCDSAVEDGAVWAHAVCLQTFVIHVDCRAHSIHTPFLEGEEEDD